MKANLLVEVVARTAKKKSREDLIRTAEPSSLREDPLVRPVVAQFFQALPGRVAALRDAERRSAWTEISSLTHQLAGASRSFGFAEIAEMAAEIELEARGQVNEKVLAKAIARFGSFCEESARGGASGL